MPTKLVDFFSERDKIKKTSIVLGVILLGLSIYSILTFISVVFQLESPLIPDHIVFKYTQFWLFQGIVYIVLAGFSAINIWINRKVILFFVIGVIIVSEFAEFFLIQQGVLFK